MFKKCKNCGKQFTYNPSVGDPGMMCPYCKKPSDIKFTGKKVDPERLQAVNKEKSNL